MSINASALNTQPIRKPNKALTREKFLSSAKEFYKNPHLRSYLTTSSLRSGKRWDVHFHLSIKHGFVYFSH